MILKGAWYIIEIIKLIPKLKFKSIYKTVTDKDL